MKPRAAVILIQGDRIALIDRHRSGRHYIVFPGGKVEPGESPAQAARREALEELGLEVEVGRMVAEVWYQGMPQYYYLANILGGRFGHGMGAEMNSLPDSDKGTYQPIWLPVEELINHPVLPNLVARLVWTAYHNGWQEKPLLVVDN